MRIHSRSTLSIHEETALRFTLQGLRFTGDKFGCRGLRGLGVELGDCGVGLGAQGSGIRDSGCGGTCPQPCHAFQRCARNHLRGGDSCFTLLSTAQPHDATRDLRSTLEFDVPNTPLGSDLV